MLFSDPSALLASCAYPLKLKTPNLRLKFQTCFARRIRQGLDAPVVEIAAAVEDYPLDSLFNGTLGHQLAHFFGRCDVAAGLHLGSKAGGGEECLALGVVNYLGVDVVERTVDVQ